MKRKIILSISSLFGVFLLLNTPLLAQSTGESREASRASRVYVTPELEISEISHYDQGFVYTTGSSAEKN